MAIKEDPADAVIFESIFEEGLKLRFWFRMLIDSAWLFFLSLAAVIIVKRVDNSGYWWITLLYLCPNFLIELLRSWKNEKFLLHTVKYVRGENMVFIKVLRYDRIFFDDKVLLQDLVVELKRLNLGYVGVPNYSLELRKQDEVLVRQRGSYVWSRKRLKDLSRRLSVLLSLEGYEVR